MYLREGAGGTQGGRWGDSRRKAAGVGGRGDSRREAERTQRGRWGGGKAAGVLEEGGIMSGRKTILETLAELLMVSSESSPLNESSST